MGTRAWVGCCVGRVAVSWADYLADRAEAATTPDQAPRQPAGPPPFQMDRRPERRRSSCAIQPLAAASVAKPAAVLRQRAHPFDFDGELSSSRWTIR